VACGLALEYYVDEAKRIYYGRGTATTRPAQHQTSPRAGRAVIAERAPGFNARILSSWGEESGRLRAFARALRLTHNLDDLLRADLLIASDGRGTATRTTDALSRRARRPPDQLVVDLREGAHHPETGAAVSRQPRHSLSRMRWPSHVDALRHPSA